ncbi:hypothetical protein BSKO_07570 [Bryopsis sp. KO-2023]|nr:hypothetical protein BSKO_07570 [Bryopsis sp. KO-2023]
MSNCETFSLPELSLEAHQVREVLRCALHTIVFCRSLGPTTPREVDSELFDVTYATCGDQEVERFLEHKVAEFCSWLERHPGQAGQLCLAFFEKRKRQSGWLGRSDERMFWEQWGICVKVTNARASRLELESASFSGSTAGESFRRERQNRLTEQVEDVVAFIVRNVNQKKDHIPAVSSPGAVSFPFDVWIPSDGKLSMGFGLMKKVLMQTCPPPMLS